MMAISRRCLARLFCLPHFRHFTYPRWVRLTLNEPQKIHFLPRKKLAAHPNTLFCPVTMRPPAYPMVTKRPNYLFFYIPYLYSPLSHCALGTLEQNNTRKIEGRLLPQLCR